MSGKKQAGRIERATTYSEKLFIADGMDKLKPDSEIEHFVSVVFMSFGNGREVKPELKKALKARFSDLFFEALCNYDLLKFEELLQAMQRKQWVRRGIGTTDRRVAHAKKWGLIPENDFPKRDETAVALLEMQDAATAPLKVIEDRLKKLKVKNPRIREMPSSSLARKLGKLFPTRKRNRRGRPN